MTFISGTVHNSQWKINYNDNLFKGIFSQTVMIHSHESKDTSAWNNWNFTSAHMYGDLEEGFYFKNTTNLLFET